MIHNFNPLRENNKLLLACPLPLNYEILCYIYKRLQHNCNGYNSIVIKVHTSNPDCYIGRSFGGLWSASSQLISNSDGGSYGHTEGNLDHEEKSNNEALQKV